MSKDSNKDEIEKYHLRKQDIEKFHRRILVELHPIGMDKPHPGKNKYKPKGVVSRRDWEGIKKSYRLLFAPLHIKIEVIEKYLEDFYRNWKDGVYPNSEKFLETLDGIFREFADLLETKNQKFYTDIQTYDELLEEFQNITNKMTYDGEGKSIGQNLLREQAIKVQAQIESYLKKRAEHGLELTDEMIKFKSLETILEEMHFETVIKPQLEIADSNRKAMYDIAEEYLPPPEPEPPPVRTDYDDLKAEFRNQQQLIKILSKDKKKYKAAIKNMRHKPTQMEMKHIIDKCLFKNGKCNNTKVGEILAIDGETAKAWIEQLGLSDYAYNPDHLK